MSTSGYGLDNRDERLLPSKRDQAIAEIYRLAKDQEPSISRDSQCHEPAARDSDNVGPEQSSYKDKAVECTTTKRTGDGQTPSPVRSELADRYISRSSDLPDIEAGSQWFIEAKNGDYGHDQLSLELNRPKAHAHWQSNYDMEKLGRLALRGQRPVEEKSFPRKSRHPDDTEVVLDSSPSMRLETGPQLMAKGGGKQKKTELTCSKSKAAIVGGCMALRDQAAITAQMNLRKHRNTKFQTQPDGSSAQQVTNDGDTNNGRRPKQRVPDFSKLSTRDREQYVADMATRQNEAQAALDRKYERIWKGYTKPWEIVREKRSKAADEMIRAAKAQAKTKPASKTQGPYILGSTSASTFDEDNPSDNKKAEVDDKGVEAVTKEAESLQSDECSLQPDTARDRPSHASRRDVAAPRSPPEPRHDSREVREAPQQDLPRSHTPASVIKGKGVAKLSARFEVADKPATAANDEPGKRQARNPNASQHDARITAAGINARLERAKAARKAAEKARRPNVETPKADAEPEKEPPKREWRKSNPALDGDSLAVRYAQLDAAKILELDRDESRRLFKLKQEQLRRERDEKWWEQKEKKEDDVSTAERYRQRMVRAKATKSRLQFEADSAEFGSR